MDIILLLSLIKQIQMLESLFHTEHVLRSTAFTELTLVERVRKLEKTA
jgi:hypothetical protein